ncbi:type VII secretion-associated serine protease mycosin [Corynebacterium hindlerae]|uniref:Type VII secretion-associated serine protease mycosin n=1 Tax=Corynebacterium hindlerae TaxID=699041 RepID=A0A7G5FHK6_9CORY|nr:type VII secretion-associated serine protease mycosin [Corynebacterium hindlerae]QMV86097.1 type VII secretion-associated serine protease mycosin [Corynebacterium hindlerae]
MRTLVLLCIFAVLAGTPAPVALAAEPECPAPIPAQAPHGSPPAELLLAHRFATGAGVKVAVIDTGVAPHPRLGQVADGGDLIGTGESGGAFHDCDGHGTIVAGVIAARPAPQHDDALLGIAPDAEIIAIRQSSSVLRSPARPEESAGTIATLADALHRAVDMDAHVINVSLASCVPAHLAGSLDARVLDEALLRAEHSGAVVIAAAGNIGTACPAGSISYPAHSPTVIAVSASETSHDLAQYSLPTSGTPYSAPGRVPVGLSPHGEGFATGMHHQTQQQPFMGTSFAAPVVSGVAALLTQRYPEDTPAQLRARLTASASPGTGHISSTTALTVIMGEAYHQQVSLTQPAEPDMRIQQRALTFLLITAIGLASLGILLAAWRKMM